MTSKRRNLTRADPLNRVKWRRVSQLLREMQQYIIKLWEMMMMNDYYTTCQNADQNQSVENEPIIHNVVDLNADIPTGPQ